MKLTRCTTVVLLCAVLLSGCMRQDPAWTSADIIAGDLYMHHESGMEFPARVEAFQRINARNYSLSGQDDVGIGYKSVLRYVPISVTVYVYPVPAIYQVASPTPQVPDPEGFLMENSFSDITRVIQSLHTDTVLLNKQTFTLEQNGRMINGRKALFQYKQPAADGQQEVLSELYLFHNGPWFVKYRATYPQTVERFAQDHIVDFIESLTIPSSSNRLAKYESGHSAG